MFFPENDLPCMLCEQVRFHAVDDNHSVGFVECRNARIALQFELEPQARLTFYPPLRLPANLKAESSFLAACQDEGDERWFDFEVNPQSGQVAWRRDLPIAEPEAIDDAIADGRAFFDECWPQLVRLVNRGAPSKPRSLWQRLIELLWEE